MWRYKKAYISIVQVASVPFIEVQNVTRWAVWISVVASCNAANCARGQYGTTKVHTRVAAHLAESVHPPVIADEDDLAIRTIARIRRGFVYYHWRLPRLHNVYGDVVRSAEGHNLGFTPPRGGIPYRGAVHLEFALGHHALGFSCTRAVFAIN